MSIFLKGEALKKNTSLRPYGLAEGKNPLIDLMASPKVKTLS